MKKVRLIQINCQSTCIYNRGYFEILLKSRNKKTIWTYSLNFFNYLFGDILSKKIQ